MKCWEQGDIDEKVIFWLFFNFRHDKAGWGVQGKLRTLQSPQVSWDSLGRTKKAWNQTLTHLRLPGLKIGDN